MTMETALRSRLKADVGLTALVAGRVDWSLRPQTDPYPSVVLQTVMDHRTQNMEGFDGNRETVIRFACYGNTKADAVAVREAVITAIAPAATQSGVSFLRAQRITVLDGGASSEIGFVHRELIEASIWHDA